MKEHCPMLNMTGFHYPAIKTLFLASFIQSCVDFSISKKTTAAAAEL
jgi:hypothetical protein